MLASALPKVLVTGASGFIGQRCLQPLLHQGFEVHAVSNREINDSTGTIYWHQADLLDSAEIKSLMRKVAASHLLHLAWIAKPGVFWTSRENLRWVAAGIELIEQFYQNGGERAVGVGSCAEYSWTSADCTEALTPLHPVSIYGKCKLAMSLAFEAAAEAAGRTSAWARVFFPYGPGESSERLIPALIRAGLSGESIDCTHGGQVRDFVYVDDVADALLSILSSSKSGYFNIGGGRGHTLREVVTVICKKLEREDFVNFGARPVPPGDALRVVADTTSIGTVIGWRPLFNIESGIDRTIAFWRNA